MGLKCSLLGHDYGDAFVERDREERGNEVVVTERELKECARCGAEKVTAENTEVRSLQSGRDAVAESTSAEPSGPQSGAAAEEPADASASSTEQASAGGGQSAAGGAGVDAGEAGGAFTSPSEAIEHAESEATGDAVGADPDGEDAVILDDDADDEPGSDQWDDPAEPESDAEPEPEPVEDDAEFVEAGAAGGQESVPQAGGPGGQAGQPEQASQGGDETAAASAGGDAAVDRSRGEWPDPEEAEDEGFDAGSGADPTESTFEFEEDDVVEADTGFTSAGPLDNDDRADANDLDYTLYCPECGLERYAGGSSLRAGDICPECRRGYLAEDR